MRESDRLHQESDRLARKKDDALALLVLGAILIVIGLLFIFLANKRENNVMVGINVYSLAFYLMILSLTAGGTLFVLGLVRSVRSSKKRKEVLKQIQQGKGRD